MEYKTFDTLDNKEFFKFEIGLNEVIYEIQNEAIKSKLKICDASLHTFGLRARKGKDPKISF